jgi:hypothetical protein
MVTQPEMKMGESKIGAHNGYEIVATATINSEVVNDKSFQTHVRSSERSYSRLYRPNG